MDPRLDPSIPRNVRGPMVHMKSKKTHKRPCTIVLYFSRMDDYGYEKNTSPRLVELIAQMAQHAGPLLLSNSDLISISALTKPSSEWYFRELLVHPPLFQISLFFDSLWISHLSSETKRDREKLTERWRCFTSSTARFSPSAPTPSITPPLLCTPLSEKNLPKFE
jgi:hypothetical protein